MQSSTYMPKQNESVVKSVAKDSMMDEYGDEYNVIPVAALSSAKPKDVKVKMTEKISQPSKK